MSTNSMRGPRLNWPRGLVVALACAAIFVPLLLIVYQSFLSAPFFNPGKTLGLDAYRFIFDDPDFGVAFRNGMIMAAGLTQWRRGWPVVSQRLTSSWSNWVTNTAPTSGPARVR